MAKFIETKDGSRMLVSDDAPDDINVGGGDVENLVGAPLAKADPISILVCFANEKYPIIPIQTDTFVVNVDTFVVNSNKFKLVGTMLLNDYAWLLEHCVESISHLEIRTNERAYKVAAGPMLLTRFLGKDINATTVNVHLSLKRYI